MFENIIRRLKGGGTPAPSQENRMPQPPSLPTAESPLSSSSMKGRGDIIDLIPQNIDALLASANKAFCSISLKKGDRIPGKHEFSDQHGIHNLTLHSPLGNNEPDKAWEIAIGGGRDGVRFKTKITNIRRTVADDSTVLLKVFEVSNSQDGILIHFSNNRPDSFGRTGSASIILKFAPGGAAKLAELLQADPTEIAKVVAKFDLSHLITLPRIEKVNSL